MPLQPSAQKQLRSWQFQAIGTAWTIETHPELSHSQKQRATQTIDEFDKVFSRFREDSLVTTLMRKPGEYDFPVDTAEMIAFYRALYDATRGLVTPLIGGLLSDSGYDAAYSLQAGALRETPAWDEVMEWNGTIVTTTRPIVLDVGAAGKGRLVDILARYLDSIGIETYTIDASGDIRHKGARGETIGLEHPYDASMVIGAIEIANQSLCGSAINRRAWGHDMNHIMNPRTKKSVQAIVATWVLADTTMVADGLATALFFVEPKQLQDWQFEYVRVHTNNSIEYSPGFVGKLYT